MKNIGNSPGIFINSFTIFLHLRRRRTLVTLWPSISLWSFGIIRSSWRRSNPAIIKCWISSLTSSLLSMSLLTCLVLPWVSSYYSCFPGQSCPQWQLGVLVPELWRFCRFTQIPETYVRQRCVWLKLSGKNKIFTCVLHKNICVEIEIISVMRRERRGLEDSACASQLQSMVDILLHREGCLDTSKLCFHVTQL